MERPKIGLRSTVEGSRRVGGRNWSACPLLLKSEGDQLPCEDDYYTWVLDLLGQGGFCYHLSPKTTAL